MDNALLARFDSENIEPYWNGHHGHHGHHDHHHDWDNYDYHYITRLGGNGPVLMMIFLMFILLIALAFAKN